MRISKGILGKIKTYTDRRVLKWWRIDRYGMGDDKSFYSYYKISESKYLKFEIYLKKNTVGFDDRVLEIQYFNGNNIMILNTIYAIKNRDFYILINSIKNVI